MYIVGFVDNSFDMFADYKKRLGRHNIELLAAQENLSKEGVLDWIFRYTIKCLIVDYKLKPNFDFVGTELVAYINSEMPDLPCMILTAYPQESLNENLVIKNLIIDRHELDARDLSPLVETLKQSVDVYNKRVQKHINDYSILLQQKENQQLTAQGEERFIYLYKLLRAYGEVDEIPTELLKPEMSDKLDTLIFKLDAYVKNLEGEKED